MRRVGVTRIKNHLRFVLKAAASAAILALIAARVDLRGAITLATSIGGPSVVTALVLIVVQTLVTAYRWQLVMAAIGVPVKFWPALQAMYVSLTLNQCLVSYVGGDAYRVFWIYREGGPFGTAVRGVVIDRVSAVIALVVMMTLGLPALLTRFQDHSLRAAILTMVVSGIVGTIAFLSGDVLSRVCPRWRLVVELETLSITVRQLLLKVPKGFAIGSLAIIVHALSAAIMWMFAQELKIGLSPVDCLLLTPPIILLAAAPIAIAGWGVREGAMVVALASIGVRREQALALSMLLGLVVLVNSLIGVLPIALNWGRFGPHRGAALQRVAMPEEAGAA